MASKDATETKAQVMRVTLVRSTIGRPPDQTATVKAMGFRRLHQTVELPDNPSTRGMVRKVAHLVKVDEGPEQ